MKLIGQAVGTQVCRAKMIDRSMTSSKVDQSHVISTNSESSIVGARYVMRLTRVFVGIEETPEYRSLLRSQPAR